MNAYQVANWCNQDVEQDHEKSHYSASQQKIIHREKYISFNLSRDLTEMNSSKLRKHP